MKLSELTPTQLSHLVWRLDHKTGCGILTAMGLARLNYGDMDLVEVFGMFVASAHSAKIHARKVINYDNPQT